MLSLTRRADTSYPRSAWSRIPGCLQRLLSYGLDMRLIAVSVVLVTCILGLVLWLSGGTEPSRHGMPEPGPEPRSLPASTATPTARAGSAPQAATVAPPAMPATVAPGQDLVNGPLSAAERILAQTNVGDVEGNEAMNDLRSADPERFLVVAEALLRQPPSATIAAYTAQHLGVLAAESTAVRRERAAALLRDEVDAAEASLRREALWALATIDDPAAAPLDLPIDDRRLDGLADLAIHRAVARNQRDRLPGIRNRLTDRDPAVRVAALHACGSWRDRESRAVIDAARNDADPLVARAAETAWAKIQDPR